MVNAYYKLYQIAKNNHGILKDKTPDDKIDQSKDGKQDNNPDNNQKYNVGGGSRAVYPKLLISEVQTAGLADDKQEFVELYNPIF